MGEELGQSRLGGLRENSQTYLSMGCGLVGRGRGWQKTMEREA
jgi:hypothetical protein